jgi:hypothetical protein
VAGQHRVYGAVGHRSTALIAHRLADQTARAAMNGAMNER